MNALDFSPLFRSAIGFDRMVRQLDQARATSESVGDRGGWIAVAAPGGDTDEGNGVPGGGAGNAASSKGSRRAARESIGEETNPVVARPVPRGGDLRQPPGYVAT